MLAYIDKQPIIDEFLQKFPTGTGAIGGHRGRCDACLVAGRCVIRSYNEIEYAFCETCIWKIYDELCIRVSLQLPEKKNELMRWHQHSERLTRICNRNRNMAAAHLAILRTWPRIGYKTLCMGCNGDGTLRDTLCGYCMTSVYAMSKQMNKCIAVWMRVDLLADLITEILRVYVHVICAV